jgi:hypothetical protein
MIRWLMLGLAFAPLAPLAPLATAAGQGTEPSIRYGVTKSKDTVTVGEPFEVRVRIRAPADAQITFPDNPDTAGTVQARDPRTIETADSVQALDETAIYRLAPWDTDSQSVRLADAIVTWNGVEKRVPIGEITIFVRSVLPADSTLRVPKPERPIWEIRPFPWWILAALLAAVAIALGIWWWLKRRGRPKPVIVVDPYARALKELRRIEAMGLIDAGERTRFVALVVEVLRDYLAARYPEATLALTSRELVAALRGREAVPREHLARVLHEADLTKFAGWALSEERARALARDVRAIIDHEHRASQPAPPSEKAAA